MKAITSFVIQSSVLALGLWAASATPAAEAAPAAAFDEPSAFMTRTKEFEAILKSSGVAAIVGRNPIDSIQLLQESGLYDVQAGPCQMTVQIGYEVPVWPPQPKVHIQKSACQ